MAKGSGRKPLPRLRGLSKGLCDSFAHQPHATDSPKHETETATGRSSTEPVCNSFRWETLVERLRISGSIAKYLNRNRGICNEFCWFKHPGEDRRNRRSHCAGIADARLLGR